MEKTDLSGAFPKRLGLFLAGSICLVFFLIQVSGFYQDDAYIVLRYVQNFLDGNGLVWNPGERVEGYTCFLWVILVSGITSLNIDPVLSTRILGIGFAFLTLALFCLFEKKGPARPGILLLSTNACFALWAMGGLETVCFGFFLFLGCSLFLHPNRTLPRLWGSGISFALAAMTRPEGALFFAISFLFLLPAPAKAEQQRRFPAAFAAGFLILTVPFFIWRYSYYQHFFPCTFYVKSGTNIFKLLFGSRYLLHFLLMFGFPLLLFFFVRGKRAFIRSQAYLLMLLACFSIYLVYVGGDHMQGFRFIVPVFPLLYLLTDKMFSAAAFSNKRQASFAVILALVFLNGIISYTAIPRGITENREAHNRSTKYAHAFNTPDPAAYIGEIIGRHIRRNWPADALIALNTAGATPYFSGYADFIDMLGLNDYQIAQRETAIDNMFVIRKLANVPKLLSSRGRREIIDAIREKYLIWEILPGHGKGDGRYVLSRKPDYIIIGPAHGDIRPWFSGDREILASPQFRQNYRLKTVVLEPKDGLYPYYPPTQTGKLLFRYYERFTH